MDAKTLSDLQLITGIGQNVTVAGVLIVAVFLFIRGDIVSKKTVEMIVESMIQKIQEGLNTRLDNIEREITRRRTGGGGGW